MSKPVCVVVGVGEGNGAALARAFSNEGMAVALLARRTAFTTKLARELTRTVNRCGAQGAMHSTHPPATAGLSRSRNPGRKAARLRVVQVQIRDRLIAQHSGYRLAQIRALNHIGVNHVVPFVEGADRYKAARQHLRHRSNVRKGLFGLLAYEDGVAGAIR